MRAKARARMRDTERERERERLQCVNLDNVERWGAGVEYHFQEI